MAIITGDINRVKEPRSCVKMIRLMVHHTDLEITREGCKGCSELFVLAELDYCTNCTQYAILAYLSIYRRTRV